MESYHTLPEMHASVPSRTEGILPSPENMRQTVLVDDIVLVIRNTQDEVKRWDSIEALLANESPRSISQMEELLLQEDGASYSAEEKETIRKTLEVVRAKKEEAHIVERVGMDGLRMEHLEKKGLQSDLMTFDKITLAPEYWSILQTFDELILTLGLDAVVDMVRNGSIHYGVVNKYLDEQYASSPELNKLSAGQKQILIDVLQDVMKRVSQVSEVEDDGLDEDSRDFVSSSFGKAA